MPVDLASAKQSVTLHKFLQKEEPNMKNYVNLNDMTLQECEHFKVEMEMKKNYYGAFMSNVLTDEMTEKMESICGCESNQ